MNTKNNKRRKESQERIESAFASMLKSRDIGQVTVSGICREAGVNRSTFYSNYTDVYDLAAKIGAKLDADIAGLYAQERDEGVDSFDFRKIVEHVYGNRAFYRAYFKLGLDATHIIDEYDRDAAERLYGGEHVDYHIAFFMAGFNAMLRKWLDEDCPFPPAEFVGILDSEYRKDLSSIPG